MYKIPEKWMEGYDKTPFMIMDGPTIADAIAMGITMFSEAWMKGATISTEFEWIGDMPIPA